MTSAYDFFLFYHETKGIPDMSASALQTPEPTNIDMATWYAEKANKSIGLEGLNMQGNVAFATMYAAIAQAEAVHRRNELLAEFNALARENHELTKQRQNDVIEQAMQKAMEAVFGDMLEQIKAEEAE